jgi:ferritin-like metal-binding protein YciE
MLPGEHHSALGKALPSTAWPEYGQAAVQSDQRPDGRLSCWLGASGADRATATCRSTEPTHDNERRLMSTKMSEPRDLFLHELGDVLYAERTLVKSLPTLQKEASDEELALGFEEHLDETQQHVKNVELAFEKLGEKPTAEKCPGIEGIKQEHDDFVSEESPSQNVLDSFLTGAGARTEHYEIAAYEVLVTMAEAMGEMEVVELLTENLEQEKTALEKLKGIGKRLAQKGTKRETAA